MLKESSAVHFRLWCSLVMIQQASLAFENFLICEGRNNVDRRVAGHGCLDLHQLILLGWLLLFLFDSRDSFFACLSPLRW